jgi:hypothetical protein
MAVKPSSTSSVASLANFCDFLQPQACRVVRRDRPRRGAEEPRERLAERLAERVPRRHVDSGHGEENDVVHAEQRVLRAQLFLDVERRHGIAFHHLGHGFDQLYDCRHVLPAEREEVRAADNSSVRFQIDQNQGCDGNGRDAGLQRPLQGRRDRAHPDVADVKLHSPLNAGLRFSMNARRPSL